MSESDPLRSEGFVPAGEPDVAVQNGSAGAGWLMRLWSRLGLGEEPTVREVLERALKEEEHGAQNFKPLERAMLLRILKIGELRVEDVMVPRADITAIEETATIERALHLFRRAGHSRIPVYGETLDDLHGMVHIKDLVSYIVDNATVPEEGANGAAVPPPMLDEEDMLPEVLPRIDLSRVDLSRTVAAAKLNRRVLFVPPSMPALNLFLRMQTTRVHLAMVIDEYGGTDGLVSIEDLVEQIVGEIEDEHDDDERLIFEDPREGLVALGRAPIPDVEAHLGLKLAEPEDAEDFDTLGGLLFTMLGRVPVRGEIISHPAGVEFEVLDADPRRLKRIKIHPARQGGTGVPEGERAER
ncbi:MAG: hemolysin family protein [Hyphomicrobiaceae bacterium]